MLKKVGEGKKLEDLNEVRGGMIGNCGTNGCSVCGANNQDNLDESYNEWKNTWFD